VGRTAYNRQRKKKGLDGMGNFSRRLGQFNEKNMAEIYTRRAKNRELERMEPIGCDIRR